MTDRKRLAEDSAEEENPSHREFTEEETPGDQAENLDSLTSLGKHAEPPTDQRDE